MQSKENSEALTITQFCSFIKNVIPSKKFTVTGEVNQLKNSHGHIFFTFKDNENCLSATIWKTKAEILKVNLKEGDKITVQGRLDFYSNAGKLNFIIDNLVTNDGIGELQKKYDMIKEQFYKKGYFNDSEKLKLTKPIKNILVLTSETGAAYHDFIYALENAGSKVNIDLIDVIVQGTECPKNICKAMESMKEEGKQYDLVVLTRGGGSFQDLFGFSQPELIETIYNFHLPVISAIGHQVDNPLSDLVSDYSAPTPSLAAQFIVDFNKDYLKKLNKINGNGLNILIMNQLQLLNRLNEKLNQKFVDFEKKTRDQLVNLIHSHLRKLDSLESRLEIFNNKDIILNGNGKIIKNANDLLKYKNKTMEIVWNNVLVKVNIESINEI
jgi:exodeoxyribonuclease VII large subunit